MKTSEYVFLNVVWIPGIFIQPMMMKLFLVSNKNYRFSGEEEKNWVWLSPMAPRKMTEAKIDGAKDERPVKCPPPMEQTDIKNLITQGPLLDNAETVVEVKTVAELEKPSTDLTKMEEENSNEVVEPEMSQYIGSEKEVNGRKTSGKAEIPEQFLFNQDIPSPGDGAAAVSRFELNLNSSSIH